MLRKFAGLDPATLGWMKRKLSGLIISHCDLFLVETKSLLSIYRNRNQCETKWFPTHRNIFRYPAANTIKQNCEKFVYIGQVRKYKGIMDLIHVSEKVSLDHPIDPLFDDLDISSLNEKRIRYLGVVQPDKIQEMMSQYDALILPTTQETEGYPGAIIEAFTVGVPVIANACGGIPEIIDGHCGILTSPNSVESLTSAIRKLKENPRIYERMQKEASIKAKNYDSKFWSERFVEYCVQITK